jgi:hypothetical protein
MNYAATKYLLTICISLILLESRGENNVINSLTVYPCDKELEFLNAVDKRVIDLVLDDKLGDRVFEDWFYAKSWEISSLPEMLMRFKPTEKYLINYITNPARTEFSLVGISRKYLNPEDNGVANVIVGHVKADNVTMLYAEPRDISFSLFDVELAALKNHLKRSTYDSLISIVSRLFLNALDDAVEFKEEIPSFEIQIPFDGKCFDYPDVSFITTSLGHLSPDELGAFTFPGNKGVLMLYPDYKKVYYDFDTIVFVDTTLPNQYHQVENQLVNVNLRFIVYTMDSSLKYKDIQAIKTYRLEYDYLGFTFQRTTDADTWGPFGSVWYKRNEFYEELNSEYFEKFIDVIRYGYFNKRF